MRRFSLTSLGLLVVLAAAAVASTSAFAVAVQPSNLPEGAKSFAGANEGVIIIHSSVGDIECKSDSELETGGLNEETSNKPPLGPFHLHLKECKNAATGLACTGLGEAEAGVILLLGTWHLVFDKELEKPFTGLTVATLFLINRATFHCTSILLIEIGAGAGGGGGEVLCLDLKPTEASTKHSYHCTGSGSPAKANEEWCKSGDEALGTEDMCLEPTVPKLEESVNKAAFKETVILGLGSRTYLVSVTGMI